MVSIANKAVYGMHINVRFLDYCIIYLLALGAQLD